MASLLYQGHGSLRLTLNDGRMVYIDPYAGEGYEPPADIVLVTHQHGDHNKLELLTLKPGATVITNEEALANGQHNCFDLNGMEIRAVTAKNLLHSPKSCVGYVIFADGVSLYVSGDTSQTEEMAELAALNLDYALYCCDGKFNMGLKESARCAALVNARHNIPIHMSPGQLFDPQRAAKWTAPNALILTPGQEIALEGKTSPQ